MTRKQKLIAEIFAEDKDTYTFTEAISKFKELKTKSKIKFVETLDLAVNLGIDARKGDQMVRGVLSLPHGLGKEVKIAVFAEGEDAKSAKEKGADAVGMDDLAESMKKGELNYNVVIAVPEAMKIVGQIGKILGPKGLMPNPKDGTVTKDVANAVASAKAGQVRIRNDKEGIVHCSIGKLDADSDHLEKNFIALMDEIKRLKPKTAKGTYLKKLTISSTMGPGIRLVIPTQ